MISKNFQEILKSILKHKNTLFPEENALKTNDETNVKQKLC